MIHFVLYDLRREPGKRRRARFEALVLPCDADLPVARRAARAAERQAALLGLVGFGARDDPRIEHRQDERRQCPENPQIKRKSHLIF